LSDPGHAPSDKPRGEEARTRRSRDGPWAKKGVRSSFGFKLHPKIDTCARYPEVAEFILDMMQQETLVVS